MRVLSQEQIELVRHQRFVQVLRHVHQHVERGSNQSGGGNRELFGGYSLQYRLSDMKLGLFIYHVDKPREILKSTGIKCEYGSSWRRELGNWFQETEDWLQQR